MGGIFSAASQVNRELRGWPRPGDMSTWEGRGVVVSSGGQMGQ